MAEQNEKDSVQTTSGSGEHREKDLSIMDYSKTYGGISKRFSNVANEKMETPKPVAIGRVLIGLMAMLDLVNTMVQIKNNANGDIVFSLGYGTIFLLIGAIVMVAGAAMILVTDLKNKKK